MTRPGRNQQTGGRPTACYQRPALVVALALAGGILLASTPCLAYIGPGAGIALVTSTWVLVIVFFTILSALLFWPFRMLAAFVKGSKLRRRAQARRLIILGLDGFDPRLAGQLLQAGKLPHFADLAKRGGFRPLATTCPPLSPVAWSSFMTGCSPGKHGIFDFLARDRATYLPVLSSSRIAAPRHSLRLGKYRLPLGKPVIRMLRGSKPFWQVLGKQGLPATVLRVPITFPPEKFRGLLLSGMCVPDLLGTQGTFSAYSEAEQEAADTIGGRRYRLERRGQWLYGEIHGPANPLSTDKADLRIPFRLSLGQNGTVRMTIQGQRLELEQGRYSDWVSLSFSTGLGPRLRGIVRFLVTQRQPALQLYMSPINIDPEKPVLPISHPWAYAAYLAKRHSPYATLGLAEDTWALNEGVIGDQAFLDQAYLNHREREKMFFDALNKQRRGLVVCVFDTPDRIQHTFWRYREPEHPARADDENLTDAIEQMYQHMDQLLGRTLARLRRGDEIMVISDHGFNDFSRGVNLNTWLLQNGYLTLRAGAGDGAWLSAVDWSRTRAYSLGLSGIYLNVKGREAQGIVEPDECQNLKQEIISALSGLRDEARSGKVAITRVWAREQAYSGPYLERAPDLVIGFAAGYRTSWDSAQGKVSERVFADNTRAWSGDHCLDPELVPGVLFTSFRHRSDSPRLIDIAPTALTLLGAEVPGYMEGKALELTDTEGDDK